MAVLKQKNENGNWSIIPLGTTVGYEVSNTAPTSLTTQLWIDTSTSANANETFKGQTKTVNIDTLGNKTVVGAINDIDTRLDKHSISTDTRIVLSNNVEYVTQSDGYFVTSVSLTGAGSNKLIAMYVGGVAIGKNVVQPSEYNMVTFYVRKGSTIKYLVGTGITDLTKTAGVFYPLS